MARHRRSPTGPPPGQEVAYVLATSGEAGIDGIDPVDGAVAARGRGASWRQGVGVDTVEFLDYPDGVVEYSVGLRRDLARAIRRHQPDTVVTGNHRDTFAPGMLNQADHRAVGQACLEAIADAGNRWIFPELISEEGLEPHKAKRVLVLSSPVSTHAMDVTGWMDLAVASLREHKAYNEGLGDHMMPTGNDPGLRRDDRAAAAGCQGGVGLELYEF